VSVTTVDAAAQRPAPDALSTGAKVAAFATLCIGFFMASLDI
jgi:hypothetical protein